MSFTVHGLAVSQGIAIGHAHLVSHALLEVAHFTVAPKHVEAEVARLHTAVARVKADLAMTGEITLTGEVLPIGGVKEKVLAAHEFGIKQLLLPEQNKSDLEELPQSVQDKLQFVYVKNVQEVLEHALVK